MNTLPLLVIGGIGAGIVALMCYGACVTAGRNDASQAAGEAAMRAARLREAEKHEVDVGLWAEMAGAALERGRDGEVWP